MTAARACTADRPPHLLAAVSALGYGHAARTAAVINALRQRLPGLRLTVRSGLPRAALGARITGDYAHLPMAGGLRMVMQPISSPRAYLSRLEARRMAWRGA